MTLMSRLALTTSVPRLHFNKSVTNISAFATSMLSNTRSVAFRNNTLKKSLTTMKSAAAVTLGIHTSAAQFRSSQAPQGAASIFDTSAATSMLAVRDYKPLQQKREFSSLNRPMQIQCSRLVNQKAMAPLTNRRYISSKRLTKNLFLYTKEPLQNEVDKTTFELEKPTGNPLVLLMAWLMAKEKHVKKYAQIYIELGFDVMVVYISPWQLLWPTKGTQAVAADTLKFLENNKSYGSIVLHGFSAAAYQFGEIMVQMSRDMERYSHILDRILCQIWDSAADITEIPIGLPMAIFPNNPRMQTALRNYTIYHLKTFHNQATVHYIRSSEMFHYTLLKKPALFYVCENDPIGPPSSNQAVREDWEKAGIKVTFKCWKHSQHTGHYIKHREEYLSLLFKHLEDCGVFEVAGIKQRAKL